MAIGLLARSVNNTVELVKHAGEQHAGRSHATHRATGERGPSSLRLFLSDGINAMGDADDPFPDGINAMGDADDAFRDGIDGMEVWR